MSNKTIVWIGAAVGSFLGGIIPEIWGADFMSMSSLLLSTLGAILGIYIAFKATQY